MAADEAPSHKPLSLTFPASTSTSGSFTAHRDPLPAILPLSVNPTSPARCPALRPRHPAMSRKHHNLRHVLPPAEQAAALAKVGSGPAATLADAGERILSGEPCRCTRMRTLAGRVRKQQGSLPAPRAASAARRRGHVVATGATAENLLTIASVLPPRPPPFKGALHLFE